MRACIFFSFENENESKNGKKGINEKHQIWRIGNKSEFRLVNFRFNLKKKIVFCHVHHLNCEANFLAPNYFKKEENIFRKYINKEENSERQNRRNH